MALYDRIGRTYATSRRADPRIASQIEVALGDAKTILNVGAGTGNYEPVGRTVFAVEPSAKMIAQRRPGGAPVVQAVAEALPFADRMFDAAMAILTIHHWHDQDRGLRELRRVSRRVVVLTHDISLLDTFWLTRDYLPQIKVHDRTRFGPPDRVAEFLGGGRIEKVLVPADCQDGFLCAFWRRPEAYLDRTVRDGISCFPTLGDDPVTEAMDRLANDLDTGAWAARNPELNAVEAMDYGYRLVVAG